jgi:hypothetical protein
VSAPPDQEAAAVIEACVAGEAETADTDDHPVLQGTVSRLSLERRTGQLFATILAGDLPITVAVSLQQSREHTVFPGRKIFIRYRRTDIKWI